MLRLRRRSSGDNLGVGAVVWEFGVWSVVT